MSKRSVFSINGKDYLSTEAAGSKWGIPTNNVTKFCKNGRVIGVEKDQSGKWCIPMNAFKPLSDDEISKILIITLYLKNKPSLTAEWLSPQLNEKDITDVYDYLYKIGVIEAFNISDYKRLPYDIVLTKAGFDIVLKNNKKNDDIDINNVITMINQLTQIFVTIHSLR